MGWETSDRRDHLPKNWAKIRVRVFERDGWQCTAKANDMRCPEPAEECDHTGARDDHRLEMLTSLCKWHHGAKTGRQGADARAAQRRAHNAKFRRVEQHPGLI